MVYQNYNTPGDYGYQGVAKRESGANALDGYTAKAKENKRQAKIAERQAKNAEKAAKAEAKRQKAQRKVMARAVLDNAGYTDIALANRKQACTGPGCKPEPALRPQTYDQRVALMNKNLRNQERAAASGPKTIIVEKTKAVPVAVPVAKGYGYYRDGNRMMPVPVTEKGYVRPSYLQAVQNGRSPEAIARDARGTSTRVYPARLTPKQAGPWIKNPGYGDIVGIDAPKDAVPTVYTKSKNIAPVSVQQPRPYAGRAPVQAPVRYGSKNVAPQAEARPYYLEYRPPLPVDKKKMESFRDPQGHNFIIPKTSENGPVPKDYLRAVNDARPAYVRERDAARASKLVLPAAPTPYQARPWVVNPGRYDIPGIDAPEGTPTTYRPPRDAEAAKRRRELNGKKVAKKNARDENGKFISAEEAKKKGIESGKSSKPKAPTSKKKNGASTKPKAPAKKDEAPIKKDGKNGQTSINANRKSASNKSSASTKKTCGTKKTAQSKKR